MYDYFYILLCVTGGYFLGSIPFGLLFVKIAGLGDIRKIGSGNIGVTNVLRTGRKDLAFGTLLFDSGKGALAVFLVLLFIPEGLEIQASLGAGCAAVLGHNFPIWLHFKGGKGVATTLGVLFATSWPTGILAGITWLIMTLLFRYASLSSLCMLGLAPFYALFLGETRLHVLTFGLLAVLTFVRHRANIQRLIKGKEPKIGKSS